MRTTCLYCTIKHLGKAAVLYPECRLGFEQHILLVIGNLSEAEDECVELYPELAAEIRLHRKELETQYVIDKKFYKFPFFDLYEKALSLLRKLLEEHEENGN